MQFTLLRRIFGPIPLKIERFLNNATDYALWYRTRNKKKTSHNHSCHLNNSKSAVLPWGFTKNEICKIPSNFLVEILERSPLVRTRKRMILRLLFRLTSTYISWSNNLSKNCIHLRNRRSSRTPCPYDSVNNCDNLSSVRGLGAGTEGPWNFSSQYVRASQEEYNLRHRLFHRLSSALGIFQSKWSHRIPQ